MQSKIYKHFVTNQVDGPWWGSEYLNKVYPPLLSASLCRFTQPHPAHVSEAHIQADMWTRSDAKQAWRKCVRTSVGTDREWQPTALVEKSFNFSCFLQLSARGVLSNILFWLFLCLCVYVCLSCLFVCGWYCVDLGACVMYGCACMFVCQGCFPHCLATLRYMWSVCTVSHCVFGKVFTSLWGMHCKNVIST